MNKTLKTSNHLSTCSANYSRLNKILSGFNKDKYSFDLLYSGKQNKAEFLIISRTPHTLSVEAKLLSEDSALIEILLRINIYVDAKLSQKLFHINKNNLFHFL